MKKSYLKATAVITLAVMLVLTAAQIPAQTSGQNALGRRIEGTWRVQITLLNCQTGAVLTDAMGNPLPPQPALNTFLAGGSMLSDPAVPPVVLRTGHGVWKHMGGRRFSNKVVFFLFNPVNGNYDGTVTINGDIDLEENSEEFTANDTAEAVDPSGNVIEVRCAIRVGERLE